MRGKNLVKSCLNYTSRRKVLLGLDHASCEVVNFFPTLGREAMRFLDSGRSLKTHPVGKTESRLSHHEEGKHRQHAEAGSLGITERPTAVISSLLTGHEQEVNQRHGLQRQHLWSHRETETLGTKQPEVWTTIHLTYWLFVLIYNHKLKNMYVRKRAQVAVCKLISFLSICSVFTAIILSGNKVFHQLQPLQLRLSHHL